MKNKKIIFSPEGFINLIEIFKKENYQFVRFNEIKQKSKHIVLRHDVDMSIESALKMASLESDMGIQATYFFLLSSHFYNLNTYDSKSYLNKISELGHTIGLHFDASIYPQKKESLEKAANEECLILEKILGKKINVISFHRPIKELQGLSGNFAGKIHAYNPFFFNEIGYCSDSQGIFRFGLPFEQESFLQRTAMQLLIHPIWWTSEKEGSNIEKLKNFLKNKNLKMESELEKNCIPFKNFLNAQN